jgi:SAM-dependent methyltransferase
VTGVDLSPAFIDAARYLAMRCGLSDRVTFQVGDAVHLPFEDAAFDTVFLQPELKERPGHLSLARNWQYRMEPPPQHVRTTDTSPGNGSKIHDDAYTTMGNVGGA